MSIQVWELFDDTTKYASLTVARDEDSRVFGHLDGTPVLDSWDPPNVYHYLPDETFTHVLPFGDFTYFDGPVFTPKSLEALQDLLDGHGELLPLPCPDGGEFFLFNVTTILDVLDRDGCEIECFPDTDRIMFIHKYAFVEERLEGAVIFRIKDLIHTVCVTKPFVDRVKEAGLTGFDFRLLSE